MAIGDVTDMAGRMFAVLPRRWFPALESAPVLGGLLAGVGCAWSFIFALISYVQQQARVSTASGAFLDMAAADFFGYALQRRENEADTQFRPRILGNLLAERATRAGVVSAVASLTNANVVVFEPGRPADTHGYGTSTNPPCGGGFGYCVQGLAYGSLELPFQFLVRADRPRQQTDLLQVNGYAQLGNPNASRASGGYGIGAIEYADEALFGYLATDDDIRAAIIAAIPANATAWLCLV